jgi:hypothetical protein
MTPRGPSLDGIKMMHNVSPPPFKISAGIMNEGGRSKMDINETLTELAYAQNV